ncbi:MAG: FAD-dependent oxidoreductase [Owenweeksia sp.]|nr:FAD-dependent oxidoreductase [Owenweeksia sp.]
METSQGRFSFSQKVFCAGLQADRMARMEGLELDMRIVGFRGDCLRTYPRGKSKVNDLIYPVPDPNFPFLGVHFTRMTDGSVECGPNAVFSFKREGYSRTAFSLRDSLEALRFIGTWKLFARHPAKGINEYKRAFSKQLFLRELQKMIPELKAGRYNPGSLRCESSGPQERWQPGR